jgi:hypothetical protein
MPISPKAIEGKSGFLFLGKGDTNNLRTFLSGEEKISASAIQILRRNFDALARSGVPAVTMVVPEAHVLYADFLPDDWSISNDRPVIQAAREIPELFYPYKLLKNLRKKQVAVYTGHDSHWTEPAAFETYRAVRRKVGRVSKFEPEYKPILLRETGDLREADLGVKMRLEQELRNIAPAGYRYIFSSNVVNHGGIQIASNPDREGRCLAFGTSFSSRLVPAYALDFRETIFCYGTAVDDFLIDFLKPDVVYIEMPERFVHYPMHVARGCTLATYHLATKDQNYPGPSIGNREDLSPEAAQLLKVVTALSRKEASDDEMAEALAIVSDVDWRAGRMIEHIVGVAKRGERLPALRMVVSGLYFRRDAFYTVAKMIDDGQIGAGEVDCFPESELGKLSKVRLFLRANQFDKARQQTIECADMYGRREATDAYRAYLGIAA